MEKKILFVAATHGNEGFTLPILKKLSKEKGMNNFDWLIANPRALKEKRRFIDADLNRVAPGALKSSKYEIRRAYELQKVFAEYETVIDLHGTPANTGIFTIVTNPSLKNLCLAASLPVERIVIWSPADLSQPGPQTQFVDKGLEIECGPKDAKEISQQLENILISIIKNEKKLFENKFYRVFGTLTKKEYQDEKVKLKEFEEVEIGSEKFYPLLINRYPDKTCYKMEKININLTNL